MPPFLVLWLLAVPAAAPSSGVVVEQVQDGFPAHAAGLRPGDVLASWERESPAAGTEATRGALLSPFDLEAAEIEQAPRGPLTLSGTRGGAPLTVRMGPGVWRLTARPPLEAAGLAAYDEMLGMVGGASHEKGLARGRQAAAAWNGQGAPLAATWLLYRLGQTAAEHRRWETADAALGDAREAALAGRDMPVVALVQEAIGRSLEERSAWVPAVEAYRAALQAYRAGPSPSLGEARLLNDVARVARALGDHDAADRDCRHALAIQHAPLHLAASATVWTELLKARRAPPEFRLVAFGDPDYSAAAPAGRTGGRGPAPPPVRGLGLHPLPESRKEVRALERLFGHSASTYLGAQATEETAKTAGRQASLVRFACHAVADEASPLDSSLALSLPTEWQPGRDNGLLQAWEIFEQVRLDADLVTLSACGTALGKEMSGEGILGLTRAFQYAGARSVLASLWGVSDASTADWMVRFYGHLRRGATKDAAIRRAQLEMMRRSTSAHPYHWAAFQLMGDWN
jgi:hypothetical protein